MVSGAVTNIAVGTILIVISFVVALAVFPTVADSAAFAKASTNVTGATDTLLDLIPLVIAAAMTIGGLVFLVAGLRGLKAD